MPEYALRAIYPKRGLEEQLNNTHSAMSENIDDFCYSKTGSKMGAKWVAEK